MPLFENSLGFTWEIANYRQVQSGGKRLTSEPHILIRHKITHVLHLLEFLLSHVGWVSARMSHTAKPDSQECQAWTLARLSKAIQDASPPPQKKCFSYSYSWLHANFSFICHAVHFLWLYSKQFLNILNDRNTEPANFTVLILTDSSLGLTFILFSSNKGSIVCEISFNPLSPFPFHPPPHPQAPALPSSHTSPTPAVPNV